MQLHPFLATVTRPVYHDRQGYLFLAIECPECKGEGKMEYDNGVDGFSKPFTAHCDSCGGMGEVFEQVDESEL